MLLIRLTGRIPGGKSGEVLIRRESPADIPYIRDLHAAAFARGADSPGHAEARLVDALRACEGWIPELSLVATDTSGTISGHVVCSRASAGSYPVLGLGPLGVLPAFQRRGVGHALMHAVLGAAEALGEPLVVLLGHRDYYPRFGFRPAEEYGIIPPDASWGPHFQVRTLTTYMPEIRGEFVYAKPFQDL
ncbi:GNAT family N-acetyltransferase [Nonomuraea aurantiaca]|uniref:GNAT family N-acetyltransferase n=1 Tax=Nonomuraea aurantiaca TaxID=2878562 RepID=UPI001CDA2719|nr:N-acetyltransferase [Nonomuraea aurantiaca]MCA2224777.1 N-acetyltransferase [Nonomuraea aurantiaca]